MNLAWLPGLGLNHDSQPFYIDSWQLFDNDSQVHEEAIIPGIVTYGTYSTPDWFGPGWVWSGDEDYSRSSAFPAIVDNRTPFPAVEQRFENRGSIPGSEFTIHQNQPHAIFTHGLLSSALSSHYVSNGRPQVVLHSNVTQVGTSGNVTLGADASTDTRRVDYHGGWRYIGSSSDAASNFEISWRLADYEGITPGSSLRLTAVATDGRGRLSGSRAAWS